MSHEFCRHFLHTQISSSTLNHCILTVPFWDLAGKLKALSVRHVQPRLLYKPLPYEVAEPDNLSEGSCETEDGDYDSDDDFDMHTGASLAAIAGHPEAPSSYLNWLQDPENPDDADECNAREAVHIATGCRTIIAAAKGGHLKRLDPGAHRHEYPFKIPALVPHWLQIEDWGAVKPFNQKKDWVTSKWLGAAMALRPFLAHASLRKDWLAPKSGLDAAESRLLTRQDLRALMNYFDNAESPTPEHLVKASRPVITLYLPWIIWDRKLAQRVLDAWAGIVKRGEADKV